MTSFTIKLIIHLLKFGFHSFELWSLYVSKEEHFHQGKTVVLNYKLGLPPYHWGTSQNKTGKKDVTLLDEINDSDYHGEIELLLDIEVSCFLRYFFVHPCPRLKWIALYSNNNKKSGLQRTQSLQKLYLGHPSNKDTFRWDSGWEQSNCRSYTYQL